ncbi:ribonuclease Z [Priestia aryabhattai]|uniref:ribonuclease Z n=1 Tax=Bacillaceae TaxID=186817 RepID=UPI000BA10A92|nr:MULTISPECIES: ribonuclease Z [Bacillaceae]MDT2045563.1 ribonuclease Z [Priestia flexa]OZT13384.1 ribonuclease Z [Priestia aryabhattai]TDB50692.1 ribonuclease Z [Bacillus sp. CBEL-1]
MELLFLGTGAGVPAKQRNVSSIALQLLQERSAVWLFDCGEATQHQILHTSIRPRRIEKIFITHLHGDHIYGLPGLLGSRSFQGGEEPLTVYGPPGIEQFIKVTLEVSQTHLKYGLKVIEVNEGVIFEDSTFKVECAKLEHGVTSYGYRIVEKDLPGALQVERLKEAGVQPGPHYKQLKEGKRICLEDGREINGAEFIGESRPGKIVTILGDTRMCKNSTKLAENANVLVHEATFAEGDEKLAYDYYHSTAKQAAQVARQANVQKLILTHISARYQGQAVERLVEGALKEFKYTVVASDLASFPVE